MNENQSTWVQNVWYGTSVLRWLLLPLSWLFGLVVVIRRALYKAGLFRSYALPVPVVIVGNLAVGGTGKTPITLWLAQEMQRSGFRPGIVSRGYRGNVGRQPVVVGATSSPEQVGDEAIMLAQHFTGPVVIHPNRVAAAQEAIRAGADIVICDDGLQHYRLAREFEIAVVDGARGMGNGHLLPAGPLREPYSRLDEVDEVLVQGESRGGMICQAQSRIFSLEISVIKHFASSETRTLESLSGSSIHAVAGIGNPERFFLKLESLGIEVFRHPLPDHAQIEPADLTFDDDLPIVMTEKDAVKCKSFASAKCWYAPAELSMSDSDRQAIIHNLQKKISLEQSTK